MSVVVPSSARRIAAQVLDRFDPKHDYAKPILDSLLDQTHERQRATDLVLGTIRNLCAIDTVIAAFSGRSIRRITPELLAIIRPAVYELVFSPETPVYSIVSEAVNVAKDIGGSKQTGFVNAVLRQVSRHILNRQVPLGQCRPTRALVQFHTTGCEFDADILPDPETSSPAYLSACFSLPQWLAADWVSDFGFERASAVCIASNRRPSVYLRINLLRTTAADLLDRFQRESIKAELVPVQGCEIVRVIAPQSVVQLAGFAEGWLTIQDLSASGAVRMLNPQPEWDILDMCAAPGTKTTQLAEATRDTARIVATDRDPERLKRVAQNIERLGLQSVSLLPYAKLEQAQASFDAVLLDAPCSNTGVLAKRTEVRHRINPAAVSQLARTQRELLDKAVTLVKPGGRICYSTCSVLRAENADVIREFLAAEKRIELVDEELVLPSTEDFDHDGAYVAILRRRT
jgi:16S rRNA (cytosine967-C5)-methyltransferase